MINKRAAKKQGSFLAALSHTRGVLIILTMDCATFYYGENWLNAAVHSQPSQGLSTNRRVVVCISRQSFHAQTRRGAFVMIYVCIISH